MHEKLVTHPPQGHSLPLPHLFRSARADGKLKFAGRRDPSREFGHLQTLSAVW